MAWTDHKISIEIKFLFETCFILIDSIDLHGPKSTKII